MRGSRGTALLTVNARPWVLVRVDGHNYGSVQPSKTFPLAAGRHRVELIGSDGTISVTTANGTTNQGQLTVVRFPNPSGLSNVGRNLVSTTASSGAPITAAPGSSGTGLVRQGFLERSNVDVVTELVNLITAQRAYEINTRAIRTSDEMLSNTTNLTR